MEFGYSLITSVGSHTPHCLEAALGFDYSAYIITYEWSYCQLILFSIAFW